MLNLNDFGVEACLSTPIPAFGPQMASTAAKRNARTVSLADPSVCDAFPRFGDIGYAKALRASVVEARLQLRAARADVLQVPQYGESTIIRAWSIRDTDRTKTVRVYASQSTNHPALFAEGDSGHTGSKKAGGTWVLDKHRVALQPSVIEAA